MEPVENNAPHNSEPTGTQVPPSAPSPVTPASNNRTLMGILSYLGILVLIPFLFEKNDAFVRFHTRQGLTLFIIGIIVYVVAYTPFSLILFPVVILLKIALFIFCVIGIVHVIQEKEVPLPLIGNLAQKLNI